MTASALATPTRLDLPERKALRADVVREYCREAGISRVVVFSCGEAATRLAALRDPTFDVLTVAPGGDLDTEHWWRPERIASAFPDRFDATSGHLPMPAMRRLADRLRDYLGPLRGGPYIVPTGSGETLVALALAYPHARWIAEYNTSPGTQYDHAAPRNPLVRALAETTGVAA